MKLLLLLLTCFASVPSFAFVASQVKAPEGFPLNDATAVIKTSGKIWSWGKVEQGYACRERDPNTHHCNVLVEYSMSYKSKSPELVINGDSLSPEQVRSQMEWMNQDTHKEDELGIQAWFNIASEVNEDGAFGPARGFAMAADVITALPQATGYVFALAHYEDTKARIKKRVNSFIDDGVTHQNGILTRTLFYH